MNYENSTADVAIPEREDMVKTDIPILDTVYNMPSSGEEVVALFDDKSLQRGVILGRPYYRSKVMEVSAQTLKVKRLDAESVIYHDSCEKG